MNIYHLYVKTHNTTGLKYLGYTTSKDPHKYTGSGIYWLSHLKMHGFDYNTEILYECDNKIDLQSMGEYYSELWDVVNSKEWANLKPETGEGGFHLSPESINKRLITRTERGCRNTNTNESIQKALATKRKNGTLNVQTPEVIEKTRQTKIKNNTLSNKDIIQKILDTKKINGTLNIVTPEVIQKMIATRKKNGTLNTITEESVAKANKTKQEKGVGVYEKITCHHCGKTMGKPHFVRWHGDNCKLK